MKQPLRTVLLLVGTLAALGVLLSQQIPNIAGKAFGSPEVLTDQADYEPGSAAQIIGSGFLPKEPVRLQVLHADGTPSTGADHAPWFVQATAHGEFLTRWHVCEDDCVGSLLELTAVGQRSGRTAETQFTDGPSAGEKLEGWFDLANQWGGTIQGVNSKYTEGDTIPLRFYASLTAGTKHTVLLKYDFGTSGPGPHFFDSLGSFDATIHNADPVAGISGAGSPTIWTNPPIIIDPTLPDKAQIAWQLRTYNVFSNSVNSVSFGPYTLVNGVKMVPVTFTVTGTTGKKNVVLAYGGHLARASDWGLSNGASTFPGASRKAFASLDGNADVNVSVNPNAIVAQADLAITKVADKDSVNAGDTLTYTITLVNNGPGAATSVVVTDALPAGTSFVSETHSRGTLTASSPLTFSLGTINAGASATIQITVKVDATAGSISNTATVSAATVDPVSANNITTKAVTINDTTPPTIQCPANVMKGTDAGQCSAVVTFTVQATDNSPGTVSVVCNPASGSTFQVGPTLVTCTATDAALNSSMCMFTVTVNDTERPQIAPPDNIVQSQCAGVVVNYPALVVTDNCSGALTVACSPTNGSIFPPGTSSVTCTATDAAGNVASTSFKVTIEDPFNKSWPTAIELELLPSASAPDLLEASKDQCITTAAQSRWFKFKVQPGSKAIVKLSGLPANYDLVLYKDIGVKFRELRDLNSAQDLVLLNAEFAAEAFSAEAFSAEAFSAEAFSAEAFSAEAFSAEAFSAEAFSAEAFSAEAFSAEAFSAEAFSAEAFSAEAFSAEAFSAEAFSGGAFSAEAFSAEAFSAEAFSAEAFSEAFSSAQTRSVLAVSAFNGVANEVVIKNTWDNDGYFYIRVRGRNGAFALGAPFHLQVGLLTGVCASIDPVLVPSTTTATAGLYKTIILTDMNRLAGSDTDKLNLLTKLAAFVARDEVKGVIVDVGADARVAAANAQADARPECPVAKNLVALTIRGIVQSYRARNSSLEYVVIVGNDHVIPFFRYPDLALLANENNYIPPVLDDTASQASLRLGYVLSQDAYGSQCDLSLKAGTFPIPDLAVGRVVETASEIAGMLDAYPATTGGVVPTPKSALVTGYDFLEDVARAVTNELKLGIGIGGTMDALIADRDKAPELSWTADQLRPLLLGTRHDLIFLAGHFSAVSLLAGDYSTHLLASELLAPSVDLKNAIFFSPGCHAGYNIVDPHAIPNVTQAPDWAQAFARKQATAVFNTGYGYGDTDLMAFSEVLYHEFSKELRAGTGPVAIGKALVRAKQIYLAATPQMRGIDDKTLLQATLFGLPMLSVDLPAGRGTPPADVSVVPLPLVPATTHPGDVLGLQSQDITVPSSPTLNSVMLTNPVDHSTVTASYLSGGDGVLVNPGEPVLPLVIKNVTVPGTVLRGVRFLGGTYSDINDVLPLTGAPVTEIRGVHAPFLSEVFYPIQPWSVNYFDALCKGTGGATRVMVTPAQFRSTTPGSITGILRKFTSMDFRLYYSANTQKYPPGDANGYAPAQAAAPDIAAVSATAENGEIHFRIRVLGDPAAGIQDVWVTYTATTGSWFGLWQSKTDLVQATGESTLWTGTLPLQGTAPGDVRFIVSAAAGNGLVSSKTKLGTDFIPGEDSGPPPSTPTTAVLQSPPTSAKYGTVASFTAVLKSNGIPSSGQSVVFILGSQKKRVVTDLGGQATANLRLLGLPGEYELQASFEGFGDLKPSLASTPFTIEKQNTVLALAAPPAAAANSAATLLLATLQDALGRPLSEKTVFFVLTGGTDPRVVPVITDFAGRASLDKALLTAVGSISDGTYTVEADFSGKIPRPPLTPLTVLEDTRYLPSSAVGTLVIDSQPPVIFCPANIVAPAPPPGQCSVVVTFTATATDQGLPVAVVCNPPSGSAFKIGTTTVNCQATDGANNIATCAFTVSVGGNKCPLSQGYWKGHADLWPVSSLKLGTKRYTKAQLIDLMNNTTTSDASVILARQLIAAMLNVANGSSCCPVCSAIDDANVLLDGCALPCGVNVNSSIGKLMINDATILGKFNLGQLTPNCAP